MRIRYFLYNTFIIETADKKIAIDPGALALYYFRLTTLIPESEWVDITHIFVTHGDPDHYWHADRVAQACGAPLVCNRSMLRSVAGRDLLLGPRSRGLKFNTHLDNVVTLSPGEEIVVDGLKVRGFETVHGPLLVKLGPFKKVVKPGPEERTGWGAIGFDIAIDGRRIVNLGDSILLTDAWQSLCNPDLLMIPIGGRVSGNTMDETEALQAVEAIRPKLVIPCHYNCPALFTRHYNPGDADQFKAGVEKLGIRCAVLGNGESIDIH